MSRLEYFTKRFLLIVPTFIGITLVCFAIIQFVPGGPVERAVLRMRGGMGTGAAEAGGAVQASGAISSEQLEAIRAHFGFDKPFYARYWKWLATDRLGMRGMSYAFPNRTAWEVIARRFPVSLIFGIAGFILSYLICIPLGIAKALRNNTPFDFASSVVVFVGYSIPAFALGMILKMLLCGTVPGLPDVFPHAGFVSDDYDSLGFWGKASDVARHMALPVACYVIGEFAILTLLMKNSLLEQVSADYVRTARAKGCSVSRAVWGHALRNSLIPIATGFGGVLTLMFTMTVLIEQVFEIPGMGRLSLEAIVGRDYVVFMGILSLTSILAMLGNILSDFCYVLIDPRIDFAK